MWVRVPPRVLGDTMKTVIDGNCIRCGRLLEEGEEGFYVSPAVISHEDVRQWGTQGVTWSRAAKNRAEQDESWVRMKLKSGRYGKGLMCKECFVKIY